MNDKLRLECTWSGPRDARNYNSGMAKELSNFAHR